MELIEVIVQNLSLVSSLARTVYRIVAAAGILIGGVWAYATYVRGRVFTEQLELGLQGRFIRTRNRTAGEAETEAMLVTCKARNTGDRMG